MIRECGQRAASSLGSSKPGEQNFSTPACFSKTKRGVNWRTFLDFTRRNFWLGQDEFLERIAESNRLYKAAEALGQLKVWDKFFQRDAVKDDVMGRPIVSLNYQRVSKVGMTGKQTHITREIPGPSNIRNQSQIQRSSTRGRL